MKYKIVCDNPEFVGKHYYVDFKAVGYTDSDDVADRFKNSGYHHGGVPIFHVEEVEQENE